MRTGPDRLVAVDLGGTLTKVAHAYADGTTTPPTRLATVVVDGQVPVEWLGGVLAEAARARPTEPCLGYAVVVPGVIDLAAGVVRAATNLGWYDLPLRERLDALTGLPGVVGHDVRSGGLAEWRLGVGRGATNLLFLPLGTGIAGAMVADGRLLDADGYAGEIGHLPVRAGGERVCDCGQRGCLETVASATGVVRSYLAAAGGAELDARRVADLARAGDPDARGAFDLAVEGLTEALHAYATLLGPETVVVGGGLAGSFDLVGPPVEAALADRLTFQRPPRLLPGSLGADAGVVGAGLVGWDRVREQRAGMQQDRVQQDRREEER